MIVQDNRRFRALSHYRIEHYFTRTSFTPFFRNVVGTHGFILSGAYKAIEDPITSVHVRVDREITSFPISTNAR